MLEAGDQQIATNCAPWLSYQHPAVRDLVWLIASAPLISHAPASALPASYAFWPNATDYLALYNRHANWLRKLDADPQPLLAFLALSHDHRLGRYAEDLLSFWLRSPDNPEFVLVSEHVALREQGITLGEPDFLVRERLSGKLWHIELALKFYLGTEDRQWLGPNRQDSLARKLEHLCQHQLPLLQTLAGQAWLKSQALDTPAPWAWLKGRLFSPFAPHTNGPHWFTPRSLHSFAKNHDYQWHMLAKIHWLAPASSTPDQHPPFDIKAALSCFPATATQALIAFQGQNEVCRAFVVGERWSQAPISLR